ncbi:hypothetical protein [Nibribacter koreensis]|uniref:CopG family transcriptional regulator n=1 Tax=Nibribacter koreensis TaxID=1084519 RepID=A0ABP8FAZ6_9BACT
MKSKPRKKAFVKAEVDPVFKDKIGRIVTERGFMNEADYIRHVLRQDALRENGNETKAA